MIVETTKGDIFEYFENKPNSILVHGCNCFNTFGSGFAKQVRMRYPEAYAVDCSTDKGDAEKLGDFSLYDYTEGRLIVNAYTQYRYGTDRRHVNYGAVASCFTKIEAIARRRYSPLILIPKIGAGLGGGDWEVIREIIDFTTREVPVVVFEL